MDNKWITSIPMWLHVSITCYTKVTNPISCLNWMIKHVFATWTFDFPLFSEKTRKFTKFTKTQRHLMNFNRFSTYPLRINIKFNTVHKSRLEIVQNMSLLPPKMIKSECTRFRVYQWKHRICWNLLILRHFTKCTTF